MPISNPAWGYETTSDDVAKDLKSEISGKSVLVTGASPNGLGADFARAIAPYNPSLIVLAGRDKSKLDATVSQLKQINAKINTRTLLLDLSSFSSIRNAASEVLSYNETIDVLVNNAGIMACPYTLTDEGIEAQLANNHIGPFLFTNKILSKLTPGGRIINVTSSAHDRSGVRFDDPNFTVNSGSYDRWTAYGQSKTANILYTIALSERLNKTPIYSFAVHPGNVMTNLLRYMPKEETDGIEKKMPFKTIPQGAATHVVAAFDPKLVQDNGSYLADCQISNVEECAKGYATKEAQLHDKLWELSEKLAGEKFSV